MVCSMVKKGVVAAALGAGALYLAFGTLAPSYVRTAFHKGRHAVKSNVPPQFDIDRARDEIASLEPAIRDNIEMLARSEVDVEYLDREIAAVRTNLAAEKKAIVAMRESLETGDFRLAGHVSYTADEIKGDLARRLDHYRNVSRTLEEKEATLKIKQKAVVAAHQQLKNMAAQKKALLAKLDGIEARLKMIEATQATNDFNFDDSALARAKRTVAELDKRLDEMARFAELEGRFSESGSDGHRGTGPRRDQGDRRRVRGPGQGLGPEDHGQEPLIRARGGPAHLPRAGRRPVHPGLRPTPPRGDRPRGVGRHEDASVPDDRAWPRGRIRPRRSTLKTWAATAMIPESGARGRDRRLRGPSRRDPRRLNLPWYGGALPMVHPGGKITMLGHWRMVLRQAEEAARAGRFDEALALVSRPDVADHHHAVKLRGRFVLDLIARASRRGGADDTAGAIADLDLAERLGAAPDILAEARLGLADRVAGEVLSDLDAGEPARVVERVEHLARHKIGGPALRRAREVAESWQAMHEEARRGEFGRARAHLDRAERLAGATAQAALASCRRDLEARQDGRLAPGRGALRRPGGGPMARDAPRRRGRPGDGPGAPRRAPGTGPGLAADRGDRPLGLLARPRRPDAAGERPERARAHPLPRRDRGPGPAAAHVPPWANAARQDEAGPRRPRGPARRARAFGTLPPLGRRGRGVSRLPERSGHPGPGRAR